LLYRFSSSGYSSPSNGEPRAYPGKPKLHRFLDKACLG
jgi:hypothetical protein